MDQMNWISAMAPAHSVDIAKDEVGRYTKPWGVTFGTCQQLWLGVSRDNKLRKRSSEFCCLFSISRDSPCFVSLLLGERLFPEMLWASENSFGGNSIMCWPGVDEKQASRIHPAPRTTQSWGCRRQKRELTWSSSFLLHLLTSYSFYSRPTLTSFPIQREGGSWAWG